MSTPISSRKRRLSRLLYVGGSGILLAPIALLYALWTGGAAVDRLHKERIANRRDIEVLRVFTARACRRASKELSASLRSAIDRSTTRPEQQDFAKDTEDLLSILHGCLPENASNDLRSKVSHHLPGSWEAALRVIEQHEPHFDRNAKQFTPYADHERYARRP